MSPTPFNVPLNAKIVAKHGATSVYALRDGRLAFVDYATNRTFVDGSRDVGSGTYGAGHNSAWADSRINAVAAKGGSRAFANTKALRPKQSSKPANYAPEEEEVPDEPFARLMPMIPKAFLDWADSYRPGDPLPPMMPGYGDAILCDKSITDDSYSQDSFGVDQVVETTLKAMGLPDINPALAFAPEPGTKSLTQLETKGILGREIRDMARNIADSILSARGLWRDELNKIRCGSGPNANRFTDIFGTGCDVPGADVAGSMVGAVRARVDLPGPVDEVAGKIEGVRESFADAADGLDVPGSRPGLGADLKRRLAGTRGGHTPHYEGDSPISGVDPAAGMSPTTTARPSKRWNWMGVRSLVSRNKQREREKQIKKREEGAERRYSAYVSSDEYRRWEADFVRTNGRMPHAGEKLHQFALHLGWTGTIKDAAGNPVIDEYGRPVGSFMGMADTAAINGEIQPGLTHFDAIIEQIVRDPRNNEISFDYLSPRQQANRRKEVADNIEEYALMTLDAMMNAGGPRQIEVVRPDGTRALVDNPEHKKRFAEVMPTYLRVKHPMDSMNNNPSLADAMVVTSVNTFVPDAESFAGQPLRPGQIPAPMTAKNLNTVMNGSTPAWVMESLDNPPFMATITLDPVFFSSKRNQTEKLAGFSDQHLGMAVSRESFLYHTADHELNHIDDFAWRLGQKLGYVGDAPGVGAGTSEWMDRLSRQSFDNTTKRWSNTIDLMRDTAPWTFLGQQVEQLQTLLSDPTTSEYERRKALWNFYMNNFQFDSRVESAYARWLAFDVPRTPGGARLSKAEQATLLQEIRDNLMARGYGEETGIPNLNFWQDMLDTPTGTWNPATRTFEFPYDPSTRRLDTAPRNIMDLPRPGALPYGQARLDNAVSNLLHGFIGGTYAGENDFEFAAELRTQLNKPGALGEIREFLADKDRNIHGLDESHFMTLVAKYVGHDEVYRLYGERPPARGTPPGAGGGAPGGGPPGGGGGGALRPAIPLGPGPTPTPPTPPGGGGTTPPPASPRLRGTATRPTIPMVPRADDPDVPSDAPPAPDGGRLRGSATRPTIPMRPSDEDSKAPSDAPEPGAPSRVRGTGVRRPTRPTTDDDLVEPTVRPETDADRVSPERRRADAERERRVRELFGDEEVNPAEGERSETRTTDSAEAASSDSPRTTASAARDELNAARERARDRRWAEREEADRRAEEASRRRAEAVFYEGVYGDVERAVEDAKRNISSDSRINPRDRERRVRTMDEQVATRRRALDRASVATDPKERRGQQIVAAALEAELMYKAGQIDYKTNERRQADLSVLADLNGTPLYRDDGGIYKLESAVPEWQRTEGLESIDDSAESVASRTALAERMFGESEASELLGIRSSETDGPTADSQADRLRLNQIREERVNATARVAEAETRHDDALRRARATGSDPDRGGDGDPAAWADYRAAYDELNDADAENNRLLRESRELEDRISKSEAPTAAATRDPSRRSYERQETPEGIIVEGETPQRQIRMINQTTGEIIYVDPSNARTMDEVRAEGFAPDVRQPTAPARRPTNWRQKPRNRSEGPRTRPREEPSWVKRERARRDRMGLADDIPGYDDEPDVGMAPPTRAESDSDGVREFLEEGDGAFMTPEQARLQRDGAVERRESAISQRERLINERDGVENGVVGRNLTDEQAQGRVEELNRQIADLERRIDDLDRTAELFSEHARKLEEGIPIRRRRGGDVEAGMARRESEEIFLQPDGTFGIRPGMEGIPEVRARRGDGTNARQARGRRSAFGEDVSAGMGRTYDRFLDVHSGVVDQKRDEIAETKRVLSPSARRNPKTVTREEAENIAATVERLFSGEMRIDRNVDGNFVTEMVSNGKEKIAVRSFVNPDLISVSPNGNLRIAVWMQITSPDGKSKYGNAFRYIEVGKDGINVEHDSITINDAYRGLGIASEFNARNENLYKAIGARSITTTGASSSSPDSDNPIMPDIILGTGATHWARNGFTWRDDEAKNRFISVIDGALTNKPGIFTEEERSRIGSLYRKNRNGTFQTDATPEDLVDFEGADRLFAEEGASIAYRRDLTQSEARTPTKSRLSRIADRLGRRRARQDDETPQPPEWDPDADMRVARARSAAEGPNAAMARNVGPRLKGDTDVEEKRVDPAPPPFSRRNSEKLTQVTADSDALNASIVQQRKALVDRYAPDRYGEPVESYADELMDNMGVARETGPSGKPMTFGEQLDQVMEFFLRTAEEDGKEDQVPDPKDSPEDREISFMKGAAKLEALKLAQTDEGKKKVREAMATAILDVLAGAEPALERDPSLRGATTVRIHMDHNSELRKFAGYADSEINADGRVELVVSLVPNVLVFDSSLFVGSDEGPLSKGQGLSEIFRFAGSDDYHFGLGVHEYAHLEHYRSWYASLGLQVGRGAPPLSEQPKGRLGDSLIGAEISRRHNFPMDATWDEVRETFANTLGNQWDARELARQHNITHAYRAPSLDHSINQIVEQLSLGSKIEQRRRESGLSAVSVGDQIESVLSPTGITFDTYRARDFGVLVSALMDYERSQKNPFSGMIPENLTEEQKRSIIAGIKMPEKLRDRLLALDPHFLEGWDGMQDDTIEFLTVPAVRKIVNDVLEGQTPEEFLAEHKRIMDQVLGYDSEFASTLGVPTDEIMRVLGRSSLYGQTNVMEAVAEARVLTFYAERFREALSVKQLEQVEEMREMLERVLPDRSGGVAVRNLTPEAKEHFARLKRMLGKVPVLKLDPEAIRS